MFYIFVKNIYSFDFWFNFEIWLVFTKFFWRINFQIKSSEASCRKITLPSTSNLYWLKQSRKGRSEASDEKVIGTWRCSCESPMDNFCRFWTLEIVTERFFKNPRFIWCVQRIKVRCYEYLLACLLTITFWKNGNLL